MSSPSAPPPLTGKLALTGKQTRYLRALAHELKPVVQVGKHGWTANLRSEIDSTLLAHELIKIRLVGESPLEPGALALHVEAEVGAAVVQTLGNTLTVYRRHPNQPKIQLPRKAPRRHGGSAP